MVYGPEMANEEFDPITWISSSGVKRLEGETDHSSLHSVAVKNICLHNGGDLPKRRLNFKRQTTEIFRHGSDSRWLSVNELEWPLFRAGRRKHVPLQKRYARRNSRTWRADAA
jgi:hypothetical protein